jgi:hypothetical protein
MVCQLMDSSIVVFWRRWASLKKNEQSDCRRHWRKQAAGFLCTRLAKAQTETVPVYLALFPFGRDGHEAPVMAREDSL